MRISNKAELLLVRSVAAMESPWRPARRNFSQSGAIRMARLHGIADLAGAGDARRRKAAQRERDQLAEAGLFNDGRPTDTGKRLVRAWCWGYPMEKLVEATERIIARAAAGDCREGGWVPEMLIAGATLDEWPSPFELLQCMLVPAMADGIIEAASTTQGLAFYRIAPAIDPADAPRLAAETIGEGEIRSPLCDVYDAQYRKTWAAILADKQRYQDLGQIPLPVGMGLLSKRGHCDEADLAGITPLFPEDCDG